jgi:SAM-dependent methyltransferase
MRASIAATLLSEVLPEGAVVEGEGVRVGDRRAPLRGDVFRFREDDGYNASFALQWNKFKSNQIDQVNGTQLSMARYAETRWPTKMPGDLILEAGCGPGRFTRILAESGARLVTFDYSAAVDACRENNEQFSNVVFAQCDIFDMPFRDGAFDRVFCHGVLQHTPDPERAFKALHAKVRPGGRISIDVYQKDGLIRPWKSKYLWRWWTSKMPPETLLRRLEWFIPKWLPFDTVIKRIPVFGRYLGAIVPCWNYFYTDLSPEQKIQWAIMDTFDALAPAFDEPRTLQDVERWFRDCGYSDFEVRRGGNGVVGNGVRPA